MIWHDVSTASTDVAVLAASLGRALSNVFPGAADLVADRLRAVRDSETDPVVLAEALTNHVQSWPDDTWLILDDYHNLMESPDAEHFISRLSAAARLVIVSRRRPSWVTARKLLYGDAREIGPSALAMTDAEAADVLQLPNSEVASGLVALASGWPAVIGLAALTPQSLASVQSELPETLHDYFAEELYQAFPDDLRTSLAELSLAPTITADTVRALFGREAAVLLEQAAIHGFLAPSADERFEIHPLLRQFLRSKLEIDGDHTNRKIRVLVTHLVTTGAWDDAFALIEHTKRVELLAPLLDASLDGMLRDGRVATIRRWLAVSSGMGFSSSQVDLARAEVLFREGRHAEAHMQALDAATGLPKEHALHSRALYRAAQSAQLADRAEDALRLHQEAARTASNTTDERQAVWGQFITHTELGQRDAALAAAVRFERSQPTSVEDRLRQAQAHLSSAIRWGGVREALQEWRHRVELVDMPCDPLVKTGFLQMLGTAFALGAAYDDALEVSELERGEAERVGLDFVLPHALCMRASAENGLRRYRAARKTIRNAVDRARTLGDNHSATNARAIEAKLLLALHKPDDALAVLEAEPAELPNLVMKSEFFAVRALAAACSDNPDRALAAAHESAAVSDLLEAELPARWAIAISRMRSGGNLEHVFTAYDRANETGHLDSVVTSYRAHPPLLKVLSADPARAPSLLTLVSAVNDHALARRFKLPLTRPPLTRASSLTTREQEVIALLGQGLSNAEIGRALWIEESTAKVHVQHIFRKLGVRSRTEAALRAAEEGLLSEG